MTAVNVRDQATKGVSLVFLRGVIGAVFGLAASVVLARLLVPADFGAAAIGSALTSGGELMMAGGLGVGLVRRLEEPSKSELRAVLGLQLVVAFVVLTGLTPAAVFLGRIAAVTFVMATSLPLIALRTPAMIMLERRLDFRRITRAELVETVAFYVSAVVLAGIGFGVWALAIAAVVRAGFGTGMLWSEGHGCRLPSASFRLVVAHARFGARFQAAQVVAVLRDQALTLGTGALAGVAAVGQWNLASQVLRLPFLLFNAMWRVSFPAMARLMEAGADMPRIVRRALGVSAVITGAVLVPLGGVGARGTTAIMGPHWAPAGQVILWAAAGLVISGPVSVAGAGFLYAAGEARVPLRAIALGAVVWIAVGLGLLRSLGPESLGVGWMAGCFVDAIILGQALNRRCGPSVIDQLPACVLAAFAGIGSALLVGHIATPSGLLGPVGAATVGELTFASIVMAAAPSTVRDTVRAVRGSIPRVGRPASLAAE